MTLSGDDFDSFFSHSGSIWFSVVVERNLVLDFVGC